MISRKQIDELVGSSESVNLTMTMPTHRKGEDVQQDPIRFKNLISTAEKILKKRGVNDQQIETFLASSRQKLEDPSFWLHAEEGLAVYINSRVSFFYKLPYTLSERVYVDDQFLITPLLPLVSLDGTYSILALSLKNVRLLHCTREQVRDMTPEDIFTTIEEFLDEQPQAHLQYHTGTGGSDAVYFGQGGSDEDRKRVTDKFFRGIEESVTRLLLQTRSPLILAGTEEIVSHYRSLNNYKHTVETPIKGSPAEARAADLQKAGWEVIQSYFLEDMYRAIDVFKNENSNRTSNNLSQIVESTVLGKTDTLFVAMDETTWGVYDNENYTVHFSSDSDESERELLNWTSLKVMEMGGQVYVLPKEEMPFHSTVAALFRF